MTAEEIAAQVEHAGKVIDEAATVLGKMTDRLQRAKELLRQWRDKHGGKEHYTFNAFHGGVATGSPTDLLRDTQKFLEGK
jgi:hypothetical protein